MGFQVILCIIIGLLAIWSIYRETVLATGRRKLAIQVRKCDLRQKRLELANFQIDEQRVALQQQVGIHQRQQVQMLDLAVELKNEQSAGREYQQLNHAMAVRLLETETYCSTLNRELTRVHSLLHQEQNKPVSTGELCLN